MPRTYRKYTLDDYEITKDGNVINKHTGKRVKGSNNRKGYLRLAVGGKFLFIHRLVAQKYLPNPHNYPQVNHKDGNKHNNAVENLEWTTNKKNRAHAVKHGLHLSGEKCPWTKLKKEQVCYIRDHTDISAVELAKMFGVAASTVGTVRQNRSWKH